MVDQHGRAIQYLRISVTDRCDLRCRYCMSEQMTFLPRSALLSLEEIAIIAERFVARGVTKIRLSGGEPLVRRDVGELVRRLGRLVGNGLDELTMTTNGTRLAEHASAMVDAGIRRVNVSLDSLDPDRFRFITRHGDVAQVIAGIRTARDAGLRVKINTVALKGLNEGEIGDILAWCIRGHRPGANRDDAAGRERRGPGGSLPATDRGVRRAVRALPAGPRPASQRWPCTLLADRGNRYAAWPDLAAHCQFLRRV